MAKDSVELPMTPEVTSGVEPRRYSTGKASSGNSGEKIVPHYLRASTGSCHDFCKYGRKHAFEAKERHSIPKRSTRKLLHQRLEESIDGIVPSVAQLRGSADSKPTKKASVVKLREAVDSHPQISDTSDNNRQELPSKSPDGQKQISDEDLVNGNRTPLVKVKPRLPKSRTSYKPKTMKQEISSTCKEVESPSKSTSGRVKTPLNITSKRVESPVKSTSKKVETPAIPTSKVRLTASKSTSKVKTSSKSTSKKGETSTELSSLKIKEMKSSDKRVTSLNPNFVSRKTLSSEGIGGLRNGEFKMEKGAASSKVAPRKLMASLRATLSPKSSLKRVASINSRKHKSLKIASHLKNQSKPKEVELEEDNNNQVEEKTLYVIMTESENTTLQSDQNASYDDESSLPQLLSSPNISASSLSQSSTQEGQEESQYVTSEFEEDSSSGNQEIEYMENGETLEVEEKCKPRKDGIVCSEDKDCPALKLKFRRGKVVETQMDKSSPRRLKFRKGKVLGEKANVKADAQRKSFKRRDGSSADTAGTTTGAEKVVLRHQDMQDKKDAQGLFNNVIEETASKLVECQKSKVKALVGAFETVISLQEKKPAANTVS